MQQPPLADASDSHNRLMVSMPVVDPIVPAAEESGHLAVPPAEEIVMKEEEVSLIQSCYFASACVDVRVCVSHMHHRERRRSCPELWTS